MGLFGSSNGTAGQGNKGPGRFRGGASDPVEEAKNKINSLAGEIRNLHQTIPQGSYAKIQKYKDLKERLSAISEICKKFPQRRQQDKNPAPGKAERETGGETEPNAQKTDGDAALPVLRHGIDTLANLFQELGFMNDTDLSTQTLDQIVAISKTNSQAGKDGLQKLLALAGETFENTTGNTTAITADIFADKIFAIGAWSPASKTVNQELVQACIEALGKFASASAYSNESRIKAVGHIKNMTSDYGKPEKGPEINSLVIDEGRTTLVKILSGCRNDSQGLLSKTVEALLSVLKADIRSQGILMQNEIDLFDSYLSLVGAFTGAATGEAARPQHPGTACEDFPRSAAPQTISSQPIPLESTALWEVLRDVTTQLAAKITFDLSNLLTEISDGTSRKASESETIKTLKANFSAAKERGLIRCENGADPVALLGQALTHIEQGHELRGNIGDAYPKNSVKNGGPGGL